MKKLFTLILLSSTLFLFGQENTDLDKLIKLGALYSKNINATGSDFKKEAEQLRTPALAHIIDALIAIGKGDKKLLTAKFLTKPPEQELKYWYVLREIHYNNQSDNPEARSNADIARATLEQEIDPRWLLDNYYYRIRGGIAKMFNNKDLSKYDIDLDNYDLNNDTEKSILFFAISNALTQRFRVLQMMKNYDKLLEFVDRLPTFNGQPYYEYTMFDFEDFDWIGYDNKESYKERHLGDLFMALNGHLAALAGTKETVATKTLYFESILFIPDYFKYAGAMEDDLQQLYNRSKE